MGRSGEAFLFLLPSEMGFVGALEATGTVMHPLELLPILGDLPVAPQEASVSPCLMQAQRMLQSARFLSTRAAASFQ